MISGGNRKPKNAELGTELARAPADKRAAQAANEPNQFDAFGSAVTIPRGPAPLATWTIRVDRAVPGVHRAVSGARVKRQVSAPDEFSAPTDVLGHRWSVVLGCAFGDAQTCHSVPSARVS